MEGIFGKVNFLRKALGEAAFDVGVDGLAAVDVGLVAEEDVEVVVGPSSAVGRGVAELLAARGELGGEEQ